MVDTLMHTMNTITIQAYSHLKSLQKILILFLFNVFQSKHKIVNTFDSKKVLLPKDITTNFLKGFSSFFDSIVTILTSA